MAGAAGAAAPVEWTIVGSEADMVGESGMREDEEERERKTGKRLGRGG